MSDESDGREWARDVPVTAAPVGFDFGDDEPTPEHHQPDPQPTRPWAPIALAACVVFAAVVAIVTLSRSTDPDTDGAADEPSATAGRTTEPSESTESTAPGVLPEPSRPTSVGVSQSDAPVEGSTPALAWIDGEILLPARITSISPSMELVALTSRGHYIEIDTASSTTSTIDLGGRIGGYNLLVGDTTAMIAPSSPGVSQLLVRRGEPPIGIDVGADDAAYVLDVTGDGDQYAVILRDLGDGRATDAVVDADGSLTTLPSLGGGDRQRHVVDIPGELVVDAGGVYQLVGGESRRLATGTILASSRRFLLLRECDVRRVCGLVVLDMVDGAERVAVVPDEVRLDGIRDVQLAPDRSALLVKFAAAGEPNGLFVDLTDGSTVPTPLALGNSTGNGSTEWAADSSGIFTLRQGQIEFVDRMTGDVTPVPIEFDERDAIVDIGVRRSPER